MYNDNKIWIAKSGDEKVFVSPKMACRHGMIAGATGTNRDHITVSKSGVKTAVVSVPQRYMHTPAEVISLSDVENSARLLAAYINCGGAFHNE